jgi:hypothetical protein
MSQWVDAVEKGLRPSPNSDSGDEKFVSLLPFPLVTPEARHARCGAKFP